jgi:trans-aconitate methyltransferase
MKKSLVVSEGVVAGNPYDKYGSKNPVARRLMHGFDQGLFELLDLAGPVDSVLEVGCGEGHVTAKLAARYAHARVLGTDFSPEIIAIARRAHPALAFEAQSVYDVTKRTDRWDLIVACEVF